MTGRTNERLTKDRNDWQSLSQDYTIVIRQLQNVNEVLRAENARLTAVVAKLIAAYRVHETPLNAVRTVEAISDVLVNSRTT